MGGDFGPGPIIAGMLLAMKTRGFKAVLVGDEEKIKPLLTQLKAKQARQIDILHTEDVFGMEESSTDALKRKESSIYKAIELCRSNGANACLSAGHSGASMSLATLRFGRVKGVLRPAIATMMPSLGGGSLLLDAGANADCEPEHLFQFGVMGEIYAQVVLGRTAPKLGLISNGEEKSKGNKLTKEAHELLKALPSFVGNAEGGSLFDGSIDVLVCDGFTGNIILKTAEGVASSIREILREQIKKSLISSVGFVLSRRAYKELKKRTSWEEYGGAPLLGVQNCMIISHGKSNALAIKNAIFQALRFSDSRLNERIEERLNAMKEGEA